MRARPVLSIAAVALVALTAPAAATVEITSKDFGGMSARSIGPAVMSGRIAALDATTSDPIHIFVGAASGGVWRSKDGGITFRAVFDDHNQSIGAVYLRRLRGRSGTLCYRRLEAPVSRQASLSYGSTSS